MIEVTLRFYAQLNDFLSPLRRSRRFRDQLTTASIKDTIEALGVPHTEVDLIVVNGEAVDFTYRLRNGDCVAVYPSFRTIDLSDAGRVGRDPARPVRFIADIHLAKLASLLRLAGFDTVVIENDEDAAECSAREGRVLLTRDVGLLKRAIVTTGYWVRHTQPERQFVEVLARYDLARDMEPFARCLRCNTPLAPAEARAVASRIPPRTRAAFDDFRECTRCGRVYWRGSHYERLAGLLHRVRDRLTGAVPNSTIRADS